MLNLLLALQEEAPVATGGLGTRVILRGLMVLLPCIAVLLALVALGQLKAFLADHPRVATRRDLGALQMIARKQLLFGRIMWFVRLAGAPMLAILLVAEFQPADIAWYIVPVIVSLVVALPLGAARRAIEAVSVAEDMKRLRDQIIQAWHGNGIFPDV